MDLKELVQNWNAPYGERLAISEDLLECTFFSTPTANRAILESNDAVVLLKKDEDLLRIHLAVPKRGRPMGKAVASSLEMTSQQSGLWKSSKIVFGGGEDHIFPGLPVNKDSDLWLQSLKPSGPEVMDFEGSLKELAALSKDSRLTPGAQWRAAMDKREEIQLIDFVREEFNGRWLNEICNDSLRGFMEHYLGFFVGAEIRGYARVYGWRSDYWAPAVYFSGPGRGVGGVGPIGVAKRFRGRGVGREMLLRSWDILLKQGCQTARVDWSLEFKFFTGVGLKLAQTYIPVYKVC